jgi:hypothetical protein
VLSGERIGVQLESMATLEFDEYSSVSHAFSASGIRACENCCRGEGRYAVDHGLA